MKQLRNLAIIAHVDHGKTTLVDALLRQSQTQLAKDLTQTSCILDSNDLERERGITIFSKNASVVWRGVKINIIDTPGHADFSGEVERVLKMADGALLLIDAQEGPMPQTRFVLKRALELRLKIIVVINKIYKPNAKINEALNKTFDLFIDLGADEAATNFPIIYASSREGKAGLSPDLSTMTDISPLFDLILSYLPEPAGDPQKPLQLLVTSINWDNFKGRVARGRIYHGSLRAGQEIAHLNRAGQVNISRLTSLAVFTGLEAEEVDQAPCGEIVAVAGIPTVTIGETLADPLHPHPLPLLKIDEPTVKITLQVNSSPFAGRDGQFTTSRQIRERLYRELDNDIALQITDSPAGGWLVAGRGELHLAVFIERLRREGYEFEVFQPQVITKIVNRQTLTPYEEVFLDLPQEYSGQVIQKLGARSGQLRDMRVSEKQVHLEFIIPTNGLFGYRSEFLTDSRGLGHEHPFSPISSRPRSAVKPCSRLPRCSRNWPNSTLWSDCRARSRRTFCRPGS